MSTADKLRQEGRRESRGRLFAEGFREGQIQMMLLAFSFNFGELSEDLVERVHRSDMFQYDRWLQRMMAGASLDEVLAE